MIEKIDSNMRANLNGRISLWSFYSSFFARIPKMNNLLIYTVFLAITGVAGLRAHAQPLTTAASPIGVSSPTAYEIVRQDLNSRVWQQEVYEIGSNGDVLTNLNQYIELASGLNHWVGGQLAPSVEEVDILLDGTAAATNGQHKAYFPTDIFEGEIELVTPDNKHLKSQPAALAYDDGSNTVLIAVLTNSIGQIINDNGVTYSNAFSGLNAD